MKFYTHPSGYFTKNNNPQVIIVIGTNVEGRHGKGLAKLAYDKFKLPYGFSRGLHLPSKCYCLITKNLKAGFTEKATGITYYKAGIRSLSFAQLKANVEELYCCALNNPNLYFVIPYKLDGNNLNGYSGEEMFALFTEDLEVPDNVLFDISFKDLDHGN